MARADLGFTALRSGGRRSATARTVTGSQRCFRAKNKTPEAFWHKILMQDPMAVLPKSFRRVREALVRHNTYSLSPGVQSRRNSASPRPTLTQRLMRSRHLVCPSGACSPLWSLSCVENPIIKSEIDSKNGTRQVIQVLPRCTH